VGYYQLIYQLFDQFERVDATPARYTEPLFEALNRLRWNNAASIRATLEDWFSAYPLSNKPDLLKRFRSKRDSDHQGAFFELVLFKLLTELGYDVAVNPPTASGTPDFFASSQLHGHFYVDATIARPKTFRDSPSEAVIFDELNNLSCPDFWLHIRTRGSLNSIPPIRKTMYDVQAWINGLDYESVKSTWNSNRQLPCYTLKHLGWILIIEAMPKGINMRGKKQHRPIGSGPMRVGFVDSVKPVRAAIHKKANRYRELCAPFVVAVNTLDLAGVDRTDALEALFGWESSTDDPDCSRVLDASQSVRKKECIWDEKKNTRVSAVILFNELQHSNIASAGVCIYENPWALYPMPAFLQRLPHGLVKGDFLRWYEGEELGTLLRIPIGWPGPK
jgi:hypothetical protein